MMLQPAGRTGLSINVSSTQRQRHIAQSLRIFERSPSAQVERKTVFGRRRKRHENAAPNIERERQREQTRDQKM